MPPTADPRSGIAVPPPLVSCIIVFLHAAAFLQEAIDSVLAQAIARLRVAGEAPP